MLPCLGRVYVFIREPACKTLRSPLQNQHWWRRGRRNRAKTCSFDVNCSLLYCAHVLMDFPDPYADQPILASEVAFFVHFETGFWAPKIYDPFLKINMGFTVKGRRRKHSYSGLVGKAWQTWTGELANTKVSHPPDSSAWALTHSRHSAALTAQHSQNSTHSTHSTHDTHNSHNTHYLRDAPCTCLWRAKFPFHGRAERQRGLGTGKLQRKLKNNVKCLVYFS